MLSCVNQPFLRTSEVEPHRGLGKTGARKILVPIKTFSQNKTLMQTALVLLKTFSWNKTCARDKVMLGRGRAHGLTILKRIYKNYKEKSSFLFAY